MTALSWGPKTFRAEPGVIRRDKAWSLSQAAGRGVRKEAQPRRTSWDSCPWVDSEQPARS